MKRLSLLGFVGLLASVLAGCPIFSGNGNGGTEGCVGFECNSGCAQPSDCLQNETCGSDGQCHPGDCSFSGCVSGFTCVNDPTSQTSSCQPGGTGGSSTGGSSTGGSSMGGSKTTGSGGSGGTTTSNPPIYCGHPADCPASEICGAKGTCQPAPCSASNTCIFGYTCANDGTCQPKSANACDKDSDCASLGPGYLCIAGPMGGGVCTASSDQCFDQSQCDPGDNCVAGKCVTSCTSNTQCRDGYTCDTTKGVCSVVSQPCTVTNDCGGATKVCVAGACVPRSTGGACGTGDVWDENGCIPNQAATFTCATDGVQDACMMGSICLHHDCWISCDAPNQSACSTQSTLNTCKPVADGTKSYNVCGTAQNLGSACGAGSMGNMMCSGASICIDGFCK